MSTPTYKILSLGLILTLGGCQAALLPSGTPTSPVTTVMLKGGVTIAAPDGYCVDPKSTKSTFSHSAVALFSCVRLQDPAGDDPTDARLYTATALTGTITDLPAFAAQLETGTGKALLSATQNVADITIHRTRVTKVAIYVDYTDTGLPQHLGQRTWKAFVNVVNNLVVHGLYAGKGDPVGYGTGEELIRSFAARTLGTN